MISGGRTAHIGQVEREPEIASDGDRLIEARPDRGDAIADIGDFADAARGVGCLRLHRLLYRSRQRVGDVDVEERRPAPALRQDLNLEGRVDVPFRREAQVAVEVNRHLARRLANAATRELGAADVSDPDLVLEAKRRGKVRARDRSDDRIAPPDTALDAELLAENPSIDRLPLVFVTQDEARASRTVRAGSVGVGGGASRDRGLGGGDERRARMS